MATSNNNKNNNNNNNAASPRPSLSITSPPSSRSSLDVPPSSGRPPADPRRNRAALRDYYKLKSPPAAARSSNEADFAKKENISEIDRDGFDAQAYVQRLLENEGLEGLIKADLSLVSGIKDLDGERKALVYDNYSKLIAAADTIGKMRANMHQLTPTTSTLEPAIAHIADTATELSSRNRLAAEKKSMSAAECSEKNKARKTVIWALSCPTRIQRLIEQGQQDAARAEYRQVLQLMEAWNDVPGTQELRKKCEDIMKELE